LLELIVKVTEFLIIVFLYVSYFWSNAFQLSNLVFRLILEKWDFVFEVVNAKLVKHYYVVVAMVSKQTLKTDRAQVVFAEGFDVFHDVDLALGVDSLANLEVVMWHFKSQINNYNIAQYLIWLR